PHCRYLPCGTDANNRTRDGVSGRYWNARPGDSEKRRRASRFRTESLYRRKTRNFRPHRFHNAPSTDQRSERHCYLTGNYDPEWDVELGAEMTLGVKQHRDDTHRLLCIVSAMAERIERSGHALISALNTTRGSTTVAAIIPVPSVLATCKPKNKKAM